MTRLSTFQNLTVLSCEQLARNRLSAAMLMRRCLISRNCVKYAMYDAIVWSFKHDSLMRSTGKCSCSPTMPSNFFLGYRDMALCNTRQYDVMCCEVSAKPDEPVGGSSAHDMLRQFDYGINRLGVPGHFVTVPLPGPHLKAAW